MVDSRFNDTGLDPVGKHPCHRCCRATACAKNSLVIKQVQLGLPIAS